MSELTINLLAAFGVLFIGLSKAGFGGGLGMLTTPLCVVAFGAGVFLLANQVLGARFAEDSAAAAGVGNAGRKAKAPGRMAFGSCPSRSMGNFALIRAWAASHRGDQKNPWWLGVTWC